MRHYFFYLLVIALFTVPWFAYNFPQEMRSVVTAVEKAGSQLASIIMPRNTKTVAGIRSRYNAPKPTRFKAAQSKVRILIVPGHESDYGGAEFGSLKERDMNVELAENLRKFLAYDNRFDVIVTRDKEDWNPVFADYFENNFDSIAAWQMAHKENFINMTRLGTVKPVAPTVFHNEAPRDIALRLYGIDKWSNENDIDIMIHVHFNDYPRNNTKRAGEYSGFTIYVPEKQFFNSTTTVALAGIVFKRLEKYNAVSDLPGEKSGIIESQDLIAVGSYNSVDAASMLIEYGYVYEPQFTDAKIRSKAIEDLAYQTYLGLQDFFVGQGSDIYGRASGTAVMPYSWPAVSENKLDSLDAYALQTALLIDGVYPPENRSKNDCPRTGTIGSCTKAAIRSFQEKYSIEGEDGRIGSKTIEVLNKTYGTI